MSALFYPSYAEVTKALIGANAKVDPAYAHGVITGFICAGYQSHGKSWLEIIIGRSSDSPELIDCKNLLIQLYDLTLQALEDPSCSFRMLLIEEDASLYDYAEALSHWCQGFISGLALTGINWQEHASEETIDIHFHISEISKLNYEEIEVSEADENALMEVYEYVRMGVMMIYTETNKSLGGSIFSGNSGHTLH